MDAVKLSGIMEITLGELWFLSGWIIVDYGSLRVIYEFGRL